MKLNILITGGFGLLGSNLYKFLKQKNNNVYILDKKKNFLKKNYQKINKKSVFLGDYLDKKLIRNIILKRKINVVFHTGAVTQVLEAIENPEYTYKNNIFGTLNCASAAIESGVKNFVLISTDKAVRPTNTMGATKRIAELILQSLAIKQNTTKFSMVRFGNVLNSSGSVIPLFKKQIIEGGPVTVTDKKIIRYFMTVTEAVELTIQAGAMATGGDVFVLDMGKPVKIEELAQKMIRLSGLKVKDDINPDGDIEIKYTGLRPGEKLYEELLIGDNVTKTENPLIMRAKEEMTSWDELKISLDKLQNLNEGFDHEKLRQILIKIVPAFNPQSEINDIMHLNKN